MDPHLSALFKRMRPGHIASILRISPQTVYGWRSVPPRRVWSLAQVSGLRPHELRPDIYGPNDVASPPPAPQATEFLRRVKRYHEKHPVTFDTENV